MSGPLELDSSVLLCEQESTATASPVQSLTARVAHLPWLLWAGRLGTSDSRNSGAGLWRLWLE